jgi:hypothetical protein
MYISPELPYIYIHSQGFGGFECQRAFNYSDSLDFCTFIHETNDVTLFVWVLVVKLSCTLLRR